MFSIVLIFIDGLGVGKDNPETNPCADKNIHLLSCFRNRSFPNGKSAGYLVPTDANLNVEGLPQSATGQSTLLTGINCAKLLGRHKPGFPNEILRNVLREKSLLKQVKDRGLSARFLNVFRPLFFTLKEKTKWRLSTTTVATLAADLPFFKIEDIQSEQALYHDFTNQKLIDRHFDVPFFSPEKAAGILTNASDRYVLTFYEYFLTDRIGHTQNMKLAIQEIYKLERFLATLLEQIDLNKTLVILTSDHGNIEDLSAKTHTRNPAMTRIWGKEAEPVASNIRSLTDITPAIIGTLNKIYG